jgi:hypothetical protein
MNIFIKKTTFMLFLIIIILVVIEIVVGYIPNSYSYKNNWITRNGSAISTLAIGHSQIYDGFVPEVFKDSTFNLGNSTQTYYENYLLLQKLDHLLPNLQYLIIPIGYNNVRESPNIELSNRIIYYHKYMHLDYDSQLSWDKFFEVSEFNRAVNKIIKYYLFNTDIVGCDSLGRRNSHNLKNRRNNWFNDNYIKDHTSIKSEEGKFYIKEIEYLNKVVEYYAKKNVKVILVSTPVSKYYRKDMNLEQRDFFISQAEKISDLQNVYYLNYYNDNQFTDLDYYDSCHLNELGAQKLTQDIYNFIKTKIKDN